MEDGFSEADVGDHNTFTFRKYEEFNNNNEVIDDDVNMVVLPTSISPIEQDDGTIVFSCKICNQQSNDYDEILLHLQTHQGEDTPPVLNDDNILIEQNNAAEPSLSNIGGSIQINTRFMESLKESFLQNIVPAMSEKSRVAFLQNQNLSDNPKKFKSIRKEITDNLVDHCIDRFGFEKPSLTQMRDLVNNLLAPNYEFMFSQKPGSASTIQALSFGRGYGGARGVDQLASQLWMSCYKKQQSLKRDRDEAEAGSVTDDGDGRPAPGPKKKGRGKNYQGEWHLNKNSVLLVKDVLMSLILGVDNDKYRQESSESEMERYEATKDITDHLQREAIYEENRAAIIHKIRNSKKVLSKVVRGFFDHPIHIKKMFFNLTGVEELETNITNNLDKIVNQMEKYLLKVDKSKEGTSLEKIRELDTLVMTEFGGNKDIRRIKIIRWTADVIARRETVPPTSRWRTRRSSPAAPSCKSGFFLTG